MAYRQSFKYSEHCSLYSFIATVICIALSISACQQQSTSQSTVFSGPMMGTQFQITLVSNSSIDENLEQGMLRVMDFVNQTMSTYIADSELNRFNRAKSNQQFFLSDDLYSVIKESLQISNLTNGLFDITVAPLVNYWGFGPNGHKAKNDTHSSQDKKLVDAMREYVGYQHLQLNEHSLIKNDARVQLDLSAIAKGYAVDQVAEYLNQQGITNFLISIGGELKAQGRNQTRDIWRVAIEKPQILGGVQKVVELNNKAIATSGDYRNYVEVDGVKYSHTIDPVLFAPKQHQLASVSVIHDSASTADALATALLIMGEADAMQFAEKHRLAAFFIIRNDVQANEPVDVRFTDEFAPYLSQ